MATKFTIPAKLAKNDQVRTLVPVLVKPEFNSVEKRKEIEKLIEEGVDPYVP